VSAKRPDLPGEQFYSQQYLKERIYLHRKDLETLAAVKVRTIGLIYHIFIYLSKTL
jgi:hypothetical protein